MSANARKWLNVTSAEDSAQVAIQYRFLKTLNNPHQFARMVSILGKSGGAKSFLISGLLESRESSIRNQIPRESPLVQIYTFKKIGPVPGWMLKDLE
jgi:hypothetical protein